MALIRKCAFHDNCQATYDFRTVSGRWAYGCDEAREHNGAYDTDGVGKATKLDGSTTRREIPDDIRQIAAEMGFDAPDDEIAAMMGIFGEEPHDA